MQAADEWVLNRRVAVTAEPTKRLTIDVPVPLHKRMKTQCAVEDLVMADVIREFLERRFPDPKLKPVSSPSGGSDVSS